MNNKIHNCVLCGGPLTGRVDKRFCDDHCRNAFHNKQQRFAHEHVREVNRILRNNYRVVKNIHECGRDAIQLGQLLKCGFKTEYFTGLERLRRGGVGLMLYDFVLKMDSQKSAVVEIQKVNSRAYAELETF